jgi:hypothetical protein
VCERDLTIPNRQKLPHPSPERQFSFEIGIPVDELLQLLRLVVRERLSVHERGGKHGREPEQSAYSRSGCHNGNIRRLPGGFFV